MMDATIDFDHNLIVILMTPLSNQCTLDTELLSATNPIPHSKILTFHTHYEFLTRYNKYI